MPTSAERRFTEAAEANPQAFEQYIRQRLGVSGFYAAKLLDLYDKLHRGGGLGAGDVKMLQAAYDGQADPREIADLAHGLEAHTAPGPHRARAYLGVLSGDTEVLNDRLHAAGKDYRDLDKLAHEYTKHTLVEAIEAKADASVPRDRAAVKVERPAADPLSARELIEAQLEPVNAREITARVNAGDPGLTAMVRDSLAEKAEQAMSTLRPEAEGVSTRSAIEAAWDLAQVEAVSIDQGYIEAQE